MFIKLIKINGKQGHQTILYYFIYSREQQRINNFWYYQYPNILLELIPSFEYVLENIVSCLFDILSIGFE